MLPPMFAIERTIHVSFRHRVLFTEDVFDRRNPLLRDVLRDPSAEGRARAMVVVDQNLAAARPSFEQEVADYFQAHQDALEVVGPPILLPGGEPAKASLDHVTTVHAQIDRRHIDRHAFVIGVGGGALLDMVGLAAATAHRGCRHVRLPTTTLSQADSGVGVKNGVNAYGKKNFVGTFAPPFAVINDFNLLDSLPPREKRAGYVEAVKVALIRDRGFFETLEGEVELLMRFDPPAMRHLIRRCAELHIDHIATGGDPFEWGSARPLDFGHWSAHKLEQLTRYRLSHGEAVAVGIALDTVYSKRVGLLSAAAANRVLALLDRLGFRLSVAELLDRDDQGELSVLSGLEEFREHLGGVLTVTLLRDIGVATEVHEMDVGEIRESIRELVWLASGLVGSHHRHP
jgi:3-dehydroquinate synthase